MIIGPIVYDAVELMVRLAATERPVAVGPLAVIYRRPVGAIAEQRPCENRQGP